MTEPLFAVICAGIVAMLALLAFLGWQTRKRRQRDVPAPAAPPADFTPRAAADVHYVATTDAENEYDRVVVHGLGLRTRARILVGEQGVVLELPSGGVFTPSSALTGVARATWTIDRAVEPGGLLRYSWRLGDREVATNIRVIGDDEEVLQALQQIGEEQHNG